MPKSMPGRIWVFMIRKGESYRSIPLYKNTMYEIDENVGKAFIDSNFCVLAEVDFKSKWTLKQRPEEYLKENPTGSKAMYARQYLAMKRGVNQLPHNYMEKPREPVILDSTPHEKRSEAPKEEKEPVVVEDADAVSE